MLTYSLDRSRSFFKPRWSSLRRNKRPKTISKKSPERISLSKLYQNRGSSLCVTLLHEEIGRRLTGSTRPPKCAANLDATVDDVVAAARIVDTPEKNRLWLRAAYTGRLELLERLRDEGVDVNCVHGDENFNALHLTAFRGSVECSRWLLANGCNVVYSVGGLSPLHFAAVGNSAAACRCLVEGGCEVDATALHAAIYADAEECVRFLLRTGVQVNAYDETGKTAVHVAADSGNLAILKLLLAEDKANVNAKTAFAKYTPLRLAAESGFVEGVRALLERGAFVDERCERGQTPLFAACKSASFDCAALLLDHGANANARDLENRTPLHAAVSENLWSLPLVRLLVDCNADVHAADAFGYTPLHTAAINQLEECVEYLIENGANAAAKTNGHISALNIINRKTPFAVKAISRRLDQSLKYDDPNMELNFRDIIRNSEVGEIGYLYTLQKEGQRDLLEHPLCQAFLHLKWQMVRPYIVLRVACSVFVAVLLSAQVLIGISGGCHGLASDEPPSDHCRNSTFGLPLIRNPAPMTVCWSVIFVFLVLNWVRIFFGFAAYKSTRRYFGEYLNLLELLVTAGFAIESNKHLRGLMFRLRLPVGAATVFCCWVYLMIIIGQLPFFGTYIAMFKKVLREFSKMTMAFFCLLVGFTVTFCALNSQYFENPIIGFIKVIAMMTGELNLELIIAAKDKTKVNEHKSSIAYFALVLVFWLFMILITIVLMNLLVGIAVFDVEGLRKKADMSKLIQQTKLIYFIEVACFRGYFPKRIADVWRRLFYISPDSYRVAIFVKPLCPNEKRLPRNLMEKALNIALSLNSKGETNAKVPAVEMRMESLEAEVVKLQNLIVAGTADGASVDKRSACEKRVQSLEDQVGQLQDAIVTKLANRATDSRTQVADARIESLESAVVNLQNVIVTLTDSLVKNCNVGYVRVDQNATGRFLDSSTETMDDVDSR